MAGRRGGRRGATTRRAGRLHPRRLFRVRRAPHRRAPHRPPRRSTCSSRRAARVHAPLAGTVHCLANNAAAEGLRTARHSPARDRETARRSSRCTGTSARRASTRLTVGQHGRPRASAIAEVGAPPGNGDWAPHLHLQLITDLLELDRDFPGVAFASRRDVWRSLSPDPNVLLGIPAERFPAPEPSDRRAARGAAIARRPQPRRVVPPAAADRARLAAVPLRRHRPRLPRRLQQRAAGRALPSPRRAGRRRSRWACSTPTRATCTRTWRATRSGSRRLLPAPLRGGSSCSTPASEANELALRLARTHTGREDVVVLEHAYHGHTTTLIDISPYKFGGPGAEDRSRGSTWRRSPTTTAAPIAAATREAGPKYAAHVGEHRGAASGARVAASRRSSRRRCRAWAGRSSSRRATWRRRTGTCGPRAACASPTRCRSGFGRLGTHFWGFETQGVVPDIVVLGKPIGNGFPLAAVVTTRGDRGVVRQRDGVLQHLRRQPGGVRGGARRARRDAGRAAAGERPARSATRLLDGLRELMARHPVVGDVRGSGLFLGVELVRDRATLEPARRRRRTWWTACASTASSPAPTARTTT